MERPVKYPQFGASLRRLRNSGNYTQQSLSDKLGVNRNTYSMWEGGFSRPNPQDEKKIAAFFNTTIDSLYNETLVNEDAVEYNSNEIKWLKEKVVLLEKIAALQTEIHELKSQNK